MVGQKASVLVGIGGALPVHWDYTSPLGGDEIGQAQVTCAVKLPEKASDCDRAVVSCQWSMMALGSPG